jgi:large subunit ribosomal protein L21
MYAIVDIQGQQFKVEKDQTLFVHRLDTEEGKSVVFDKVVLVDNGGKVSVGAPLVKGASVKAKVLEHMKGDKVIVFKKKRRKGYKVKNGHRQYMTKIQINSVSAGGKTAVKKEETAKKAAPKAEAKKPAAKKPAAKKTTAKKEVKEDK